MRYFRREMMVGLILAGSVLLNGVEAAKPTKSANKPPTKAQIRKAQQQEALKSVVAAAEAGDPQSQMIAGLAYLQGKKVPKDLGKGVSFLESASEKGNKEASCALIEIYEKGKYGVAKDPAKAEALYAKLGIASPAATKAGYAAMKSQLDALLQSNDERAVFINKAKDLDKNSPLTELASAVVEGTRLMEKAHGQKPVDAPASEIASAPVQP